MLSIILFRKRKPTPAILYSTLVFSAASLLIVCKLIANEKEKFEKNPLVSKKQFLQTLCTSCPIQREDAEEFWNTIDQNQLNACQLRRIIYMAQLEQKKKGPIYVDWITTTARLIAQENQKIPTLELISRMVPIYIHAATRPYIKQWLEKITQWALKDDSVTLMQGTRRSSRPDRTTSSSPPGIQSKMGSLLLSTGKRVRDGVVLAKDGMQERVHRIVQRYLSNALDIMAGRLKRTLKDEDMPEALKVSH